MKGEAFKITLKEGYFPEPFNHELAAANELKIWDGIKTESTRPDNKHFEDDGAYADDSDMED